MRRHVWVGLAVTAMVLTGCTDPGVVTPPPGPHPTGPHGDITVRACTPEAPLLPAASVGSCGLVVTDAINARLTRLDAGRPVLDLAEAIDTPDSQHYTVQLAPGQKFHNGTEVKARNFVAAWNWAAYGPNAMAAQDWFAVIEGGAEMNCPVEGPCNKDGRPTQLAGVEVVDDYTFTIETVEPIGDFQTLLSHPVFSPLPDVFFAEDEGKHAFGRLPVGSGPFEITGNNNTELTLTAFADYDGTPRPKVETVTLKKYDNSERGRDVNRAYAEVVADSLDFTDVIPTDLLVDDVWQEDLAGRFGLAPAQSVEQLTFIASDPQLTDPRVRRAISLALDREALTRQVFADTRVPATGWVAPTVPDYESEACGQLCTYRLGEARRLFAEAGGYPGEFSVTVNADGGHKQWADSVCNQLKNALELDCQVHTLDNQADLLGALRAGDLTGVVRVSWPMGYPSPAASLRQFITDSPLNRVGYSNEEFDAAMATALQAPSRSAAYEAYREAELLLVSDPPSVPLWFAATPFAHSTHVTDVRINSYGTLDLLAVRAA